ncbi:cell wall binding repeat 2-containing protein [Syntrophobotulus glycolicus DSM 8271]|uniref:Cell wall binding repeat 2-containing protein n=1 Tax=Syntrophobotulus glycolicus (strain DSM 8271 / FlGlyR) TaxID=645991 RepID=F0SXZ0_SYNGF|nr:cell wall-binding repeat-containing protein [Syntrophobotulus glycolicus]ADY57051.1 cell wall binding repeat 2-containing protein [Syntrophobotulus glycolicus DSM 8271]
MIKKHLRNVFSVFTIFLVVLQFSFLFVITSADHQAQAATEQKSYTNQRLAGEERIGTSLAIASEYNAGTVRNVILSTAYNFPDALAGSVLAKKLDAPILFIGNTSGANEQVFHYLENHLDPGGNIYILGGQSVISDEIISSIQALGYQNFVRLGGSDRIQTDLKILDKLDVTEGTPVVIVTQNDFPDALSISSIAALNGYPILLTGQNTIDSGILKAIRSIKPDQIFIVGGTGVVSGDIENQLKSYTPAVVRISGTNRFETSLAINNYFNQDTDSAVIASGYYFADALAGSALAAKLNAPIVLLDHNNIEKQKEFLDSSKITNLYILGGRGVISESTAANLSKTASSSEKQVFSGWLGDSDCSPEKADPTAMSNQCLKCPKCVASGYGISVKQGDGTYVYYKFDENGHKLAQDIVANATSLKVPAIKAEGVLTGERVSIGGKDYPVLNVFSIIAIEAAGTEQAFTGYIIDEDCFAAMPDDPGSDTITCLRMAPCAASGYGIAVAQDDGAYQFYYLDGAFAPQASGGQEKAAALLKNTLKKDHVSIKITGTLKGDHKVSPSDGISYPVITVSSLVEN